ncbi:unnamed protein product [Ectocarpus sp. 13 AM-2016]
MRKKHFSAVVDQCFCWIPTLWCIVRHISGNGSAPHNEEKVIETTLGLNSASNSATLYTTACQGIYAEAEPLYAQCQAIFEKTLGSGHPNVATLLNNRAEMLSKQMRDVYQFEDS